MRLLLAEDSALLREALVALLERLGHKVVATASTAPELLAAFERLRAAGTLPDLVLTDVRMPPGMSDDGLIAALRIREQCPRQPVMVLSQHIADTYARELLTLPEGATGYLLKDRINRVRDFAGALETVAAGGTVIDPDVVQRLLSRAPRGPLEALSPREHEVLALMADGRSNTGIASALTLSDAAVSKHIGNIFMKLGLSPVEENRRVKAVLTYLDQQR
ncbi:MAG TPA: response regulator transcription factor [Microbacteriaceae bacterium]|jgi:DNA-binding NarL/FixJ family response regulator|nr:response regulator transcription factor [Microbacteriaceae bacterium]HQX35554.1 response regulator transcription factor [Microbacteriaceae bacterium]HQZ46855.1 response regulator transcription factor [Microbacteriaceae bacterium]HRA09427.1 response regulator transcription factor [Microbacteriaceae bacterium]